MPISDQFPLMTPGSRVTSRASTQSTAGFIATHILGRAVRISLLLAIHHQHPGKWPARGQHPHHHGPDQPLAWLGVTAYCLATVRVLRALQQRAVRRNVTDRQASAEQYGTIEERLTATEAANLNPAAASRPQ
jgi:hypothetical protein